MIREQIKKVVSGHDLSREDALSTMDLILDGRVSGAQTAAFLVGLKMKGERPEEVAGLVASVRRHAVTVSVEDPRAVDCTGTGGDSARSFNISTAAALVAWAAGATVAKQGNRLVGSRCGSADMVEALGAKLNPLPQQVEKSLNELGFGYLYGPRFHPSLQPVLEIQREIGARTTLSIIGPLVNPAGVTRLLVGVYDKELMSLTADVLRMTGAEHVMVVHSRDGMDELSVSGPTDYLELDRDTISVKTLSPEDVGLPVYPFGAVSGGDPKDNARIFRNILAGQPGACRDATVFNAGAVLYLADKVESVAEGVMSAQQALDSGAAAEKLETWLVSTKMSDNTAGNHNV